MHAAQSAGARIRGTRACGVRVPGSTSNLGAGFDCVGMAVDMWLAARAVISDEVGERAVLTVTRSGTLAGLACPPENDLLVRGFVAACALRDRTAPRHISFDVASEIPVARGLGSSAAAIVAGVALASHALDLSLTPHEMIAVAAALDGHPDNAAPAVMGGAVVCVPQRPGCFHVEALPVCSSLRFVFAVPDFEYRTQDARAALPSELPFATAVEAAGRAAALVRGLETGNRSMLAAGLADVLHVPFRRAHVAGYDAVTQSAIAAGAVGATLSGSGSAIVAICDGESGCSAGEVGEAMRQAWRSAGVGARTFLSRPGVTGLTSTTC